MKRCVEAGDRRGVGEQPAHFDDAGQRCGQVKGRKVGDRAQVPDDPGIYAHRVGESTTAVHDSMADGADAGHFAKGALQADDVDAIRGFEVVLGDDDVALAEEADLEGARSCVQYEDVQPQ